MTADGREGIWRDRRQAGRQLAGLLAPHVGHPQATTVMGIPPGGMEVAAALAAVLQLPLCSWSVQRVLAPGSPAQPIGAIAPGNIQLLDEGWLQRLGLDGEGRLALLHRHQRRMERDQRRFGDPGPAELSHRRLILVDEGIRSGLAMGAAVLSLRSLYPSAILVAAPVASRDALEQLQLLADQVVVLRPVPCLPHLSEWFASLPPLRPGEVIALLQAA